MKHHMCAGYRVGKRHHRHRREKLGGTGKENSPPREICRDTSCFAFEYLEGKNLGALIEIIEIQKNLQRTAIAFVDNTIFCANGLGFKAKMQQIMNIYAKLHEAKGDKMQQAKIVFYYWS